MSTQRTKMISSAVGAGIGLLVIGCWLCAGNSRIKVAPAFSERDVKVIRSLVSRQRWAEVRRSIAAHDFERVWHLGLPVMFSRVESIAGYPGPPGGAYVVCRGVWPGTQCSVMLFNSTNGWKCDRMDVIDAATARQIREMERKNSAEQR